MSTKYINTPVPGASEYFPLNDPPIGSALPADAYPQNKELPPLFQPLTIRGMTIPNRIIVSPMCQYSSDNGHATTWHLVHIGGFATRGVGAIISEATAVAPEGRISPEDAGLWTDSQIAPLRRIADFVHAQGGRIGVQLAHAGRKASTLAPWLRGGANRELNAERNVAYADENGWPDEVVGPSALLFGNDFPQPKEMTVEQIKELVDKFAAATHRALAAGYDFIEIHGAHGYLIHSFLSPLSNVRADAYGGAFENRVRILLEIVDAVRGAMPETMPLFVRVSATDWAPDVPEQDPDTGVWRQWGSAQTVLLAGALASRGVDLLDVSSGGNVQAQRIPLGPAYQAPFAEAVKRAHPGLLVGAVGMINEPAVADGLLRDGKADVVLLARELMRDPNFVFTAALELGVAVKPAVQYERAWTRVWQPKKKL
ncbi:FMN-linked oxidoreductase [Vararia minispora EC-137]|uniref:FMN-linked oxidoreductase n=1 Tax=Vararia minispora EC-137 TaxID=1314806 RepID=A0ACB8QFX6_9AGAM|nr:FMN-linked oxidoreductase [Vararia minispora EC-137]